MSSVPRHQNERGQGGGGRDVTMEISMARLRITGQYSIQCPYLGIYHILRSSAISQYEFHHLLKF